MIEKYAGKKYLPGNFVDRNGHVLGTHRGVIRYTVGQRRKLGISSAKPLYVCEIRAGENAVVLGEEQDLMRKEMVAEEVNWISGRAPKEPFRCKVKIRYRKPEQWAWIIPSDEGNMKVVFDEPQRAVTPGQAAVMYQDDIVLGGGTIISVEEDSHIYKW